jgi:TonB family protein
MVRPIYPFTATSAPVAGTVVLQVVVDPTGNVERVNVVQGDSRLVPVAVNAVKQWKYAPTYRNGVPVEAVTTVSINITPSE